MADAKIPRILTMADQKVDESTLNELLGEMEVRDIGLQEFPKTGAAVPPAVELDELSPEKQAEVKKAMEDLKTTKDKPGETLVTPTMCRYCGHDPVGDPVEITDADKEEFVHSIMAKRPFRKTYAMFGGKMKITFRIRTMVENDLIAEQCNLEIEDGRIPTTSLGLASQIYHIRLRRLQMAVSLLRVEPTIPVELPSINTPEGKKAYPPDFRTDTDNKPKLHKNAVGVAHDTLFNDWPEPIFAMAFKLYSLFEQTYVRLMEQSVSPDFWTETVG
jgi:predicted Zn-ribbon and HTH transcriptional regulator